MFAGSVVLCLLFPSIDICYNFCWWFGGNWLKVLRMEMGLLLMNL
jgi:hypothetical protein